MPPDYLPRGPIEKRKGANLPHWTAQHAIYFVTFRLADSLPQAVVESYRSERDRLMAAFRETQCHETGFQFTQGDALRLQELFAEKIERYLDAGSGACWMKRPVIADLVQSALLFFDGQRYDLHAWCVMPNHVHVVFQSISHDLSSVLHSWKSFTAKQANKELGRTGEFWQAESYDHIVRNQQEYLHCVRYTWENPAVAGLVNWRWAGRRASGEEAQ